MSQLLTGHDDTVWHWAGKHFRKPIPKPDWAVGILNDHGILHGALIGHERNTATVELTLASDGVITPAIARAFFRSIFARYHRLEIKVHQANRRTKKAAPKWGFKFEGSARDYFGPGENALTYRMLAADCRWLKRGT